MDHHLVPKEFGGKTKIPTCRACHKAIHALFTNRELLNTYHTVEALMGHEGYRRMVSYIRKQDPRRKVRFRRSKSRGR